jgi:hypothetical protein
MVNPALVLGKIFRARGGMGKTPTPYQNGHPLCHYCLHAEWRMRGHAALKRAGISTVTDLLNLDYQEFWRQRLLLYAVDLRDLGRRHFNHFNRTQRRGGWVSLYGRLRYDHDLATEAISRRSCSITVLHSSLLPEPSGVAIVPEVPHRKAAKSILSSRTEDGSSLVAVCRPARLEKTELCPILNLRRHATDF